MNSGVSSQARIGAAIDFLLNSDSWVLNSCLSALCVLCVLCGEIVILPILVGRS